jgi:two-component system, chemotaxis family, sensor kinase CheA
MDEFERELKVGFLEEAAQLQGDVEQCFLSLESNPDDPAILEKIFRLAHNMKGSSKAVGFDDLGAFTHEFESFLLKLKKGELKVVKAAVDLLLKANDHLRASIDALKGDLDAKLDHDALIQEFKGYQELPESTPALDEAEASASLPSAGDSRFEEEDAPAAVGSNDIQTPIVPQTQELSSDLKEMAQLTSENLSHIPSPAKPVTSPAPASPAGSAGSKGPAAEESIRVSLSRVEKLVNLVGEVVILQTVLREQAGISNPQVRKTIHHLGKVTKEVQDLAMGLRMVPLKQTFQKMQRIVRDTSALLNKKVNLVLEGEETEVDKTVLESLGDPLVHMVRNAVDHGIESPADRLAKGKPETGQLLLRAFHQSGKLVLEIQDDGAGIDGERLKHKATEKGLLRAGASLSPQQSIELIFHPGFSTKAEVTEVSGRGVGMDVVKTNIEALQGHVEVSTDLGKGSTFRVSLPLTLAIIDGMIVRSGEDRFVIPLTHVHESVRPLAKDLRQTSGIGEVLLLRGENLPVIRLSKILGQGKKPAPAGATVAKESPANGDLNGIAVIVRVADQPFAALVDDILGQHQVVIKKVGAEIQGIKGFAGSAILGDGRPALILELPELFSERRVA